MTETGTHLRRGRRWRSRGALLFVALAAGFAGTATVVSQTTGPAADRAAGPVTAREVVASGTLPYYGAWELVTSSAAGGGSCVGLRLVDPPPFQPTLVEGCGGEAVENQVGVLTGERGTLFAGRVLPDGARVKIEPSGSTPVFADTVRGRDGRRYVVTAIAARAANVAVTLFDAKGRRLGRVDPAAKAATGTG